MRLTYKGTDEEVGIKDSIVKQVMNNNLTDALAWFNTQAETTAGMKRVLRVCFILSFLCAKRILKKDKAS